MRRIVYPFIPKSTSFMLEGQFWDVPLSNGRFACGRVIEFDYTSGRRDTRAFLAGLLDWSGDELPTADAIAGCKLVDSGNSHIRSVSHNGGMVRGFRALELDGIEPPLRLSESPGKGCRVMRGYADAGPASLEHQMTLDVHSTWGLAVISVTAEAYFVKNSPPPRWSPWEFHLGIQEYVRQHYGSQD